MSTVHPRCLEGSQGEPTTAAEQVDHAQLARPWRRFGPCPALNPALGAKVLGHSRIIARTPKAYFNSLVCWTNPSSHLGLRAFPPRDIPTRVWRNWNIDEWGEHLLGHFFGRHARGEAGPVDVLLVTAEELAAATGDAGADPDEAKSAFVAAMLAEIGDLSVMDHAYNAPWSPKVPEIAPPVLAHLMLSCLAASESSDDLGDEGSFIRRLDAMTAGRFGRLEDLARQWERFAEWLSAGRNPLRYRQLILPDPGHLTRIGYTVNLAFPDRRDQRALSSLLHRNGIGAEHPPLGRIIRLISANRQDFKPRFLEAFDDFRALADAGVGSDIHRHRCWSAIMAALARGRREAGPAIAASSRLNLIAWLADDDAAFCIASEEASHPKGFRSWPLPVPYGPFKHALTADAADQLNETAIAAAVGNVLDGRLRVSTLVAAVSEGFVPLGMPSGAYFEFQIPDEIDIPTMALVRTDLLSTAMRLFGGYELASPHPSWRVLAGCKIRPLPAATGEHEPLGRCWTIHATASRPKIRVSGGIRVDDGWLAHPQLLPSIRFPVDAVLTLDDGLVERTLVKHQDAWVLPRETLAGTSTITARRDGQLLDVKAIRLHAVPAAEEYRSASEPAAWWRETSYGTVRLSEGDITGSSGTADTSALTELRAYLGPDVGEFRFGPDGAAWTAVRQSGQILTARADPSLAARLPVHQNEDKGANRRWRKILATTMPSDDPGFAAAKSAIWQVATSHLPKLRFEAAPDLLKYDPATAAPHPELPNLIAAVAARAASTAGLPLVEFHELSGLVMQLDLRLRRLLTRSWLEAGMIDLACFARWGSRRIYARRPVLVAYREGTSHVAALQGLALPRTRQVVEKAAERRKLAVWEKLGLGPFTPAMSCVRSTMAGDLQLLAAECGLPLRWLAPDISALLDLDAIETGLPEPGGYEHQHNLSPWRVDSAPQPEASITTCYRPDAPMFWRARVGQQQRWSYALNPARLAACAMARLPPCTPRGSHELIAARAYLPLPLARMVAILGPALPGGMTTTPESPHLYGFNTERFRKIVEELLARVQDQTLPNNGDSANA